MSKSEKAHNRERMKDYVPNTYCMCLCTWCICVDNSSLYVCICIMINMKHVLCVVLSVSGNQLCGEI